MSQVKEFLEDMATKFKPETAKDLEAVFQYQLTEGDEYYLTIKDRTCTLTKGQHSDPTATMKLNFETFQKMANGELDGMKAMMFGKLKVKGNMMLAARIPQIFADK